MSHENSKPSHLDPFERCLASFRPAQTSVDRDRLMFLSGRASVEGGAALSAPEEHGTQYSVRCPQYSSRSQRGGWLWPASTAALAATSLTLAIALLRQPEPRVVVVERAAPASSPASPAPVVIASGSFEKPLPRQAERLISRIPAENYLRTREVALRMGLDAIGRQPTGTGQPTPTYGDLLLDLSGLKKPAAGGEPRSSRPFNM